MRRTSVIPYWLLIVLALGFGGTVGALGIAVTTARQQATPVAVPRTTTTVPRTAVVPIEPPPARPTDAAAVGQIQSLSEQVGSLEADLAQAQRDAAALNDQRQQQAQGVAQAQAELQSSQQQVQATQQQLQTVEQQRQSQLNDLSTRVQSIDQQLTQLEQLANQLRGMLGLPSAQTPPVGGPTAADLAGIPSFQSLSGQISSDLNRVSALQMSLDEANQTAQAQFSAAQQAIAASNIPTGPASLSTTPRGAPVNGVVTQPFGPTSFTSEPPYGPYPHFHTGIDLAVPTGTPVKATAAGTVAIAGWDGGYGNLVEIDHGNGIQTLYGHNSQLLVTVGEQVKAGQVISLSGSTGNSTGPHVHYEIRINGTPVDPAPFIALGS
ncbi:MAG TPA: M23 family metallopeptidase [Thermomicrobiaceae bacterium]|nr:M23 family metallopeptidase [Thermomicrobiaceae bacterium]